MITLLMNMSLNLVKEIKQAFSTVNDQIEAYLQHENQDWSLIQANFQLIKQLLQELKSVDPNSEYQRLACYYHLMDAAYLRAVGRLEEAKRHDEASKKHGILQAIRYSLKPDEDDQSVMSVSRTAPYLGYLHEMLKVGADKSDIYNKIAWFYHRKGKYEEKMHQLISLAYWQYAKNNYKLSLDMDPKHLQSASGYAKCLVKMSKYKAAVLFLKKYKDENDRASIQDYYLVKAVAYRKQYKYEKAKRELLKATEGSSSKNPELRKEAELLKRIEEHSKETKLEEYEKNEAEYKVENYEQRQNAETYKVLSVDGGGIRGIIPAFWISEIEKRTHKPIAHLFNMVAGTSTGGIITAGLTLPKDQDGFTPMYRAHDILEIYLNRGPRIFSGNNYMRFFRSKYTDRGRYDLFSFYFQKKTLAEALTELVIPAANEESLYTTYLFNRYDARVDPFKNDTFLDALMATSAAPTFFPSHRIQGKGVFNDGGVHVNNPSSVACSEALRYGVSKEQLFVLSLGTGSYIPKALKNESSRGLLFWASHLHDVALQAQVGNADIAMSNALGRKKYQRYQVWLENPIRLDDYHPENLNILMESANQFIEEADYSDANSFNKLIEYLNE